MMQCEETVRAVDEVVQWCLERAGIDQPPVDPVDVADAWGLSTQRDTALQARGERRTINGQGLILIRPDERDERECFAIAHEIGEELAAGLVMERLGLTEDCDRWREELANQFAARLLCPQKWLRECIGLTSVDLRLLKETFATASHEVIARQLLSLEVPSVITVFDNGTISSRRSNVAVQHRMCPLEESTWRDCRSSGRDVHEQVGSLRVQAWALHEDDWHREILRTTRLDT